MNSKWSCPGLEMCGNVRFEHRWQSHSTDQLCPTDWSPVLTFTATILNYHQWLCPHSCSYSVFIYPGAAMGVFFKLSMYFLLLFCFSHLKSSLSMVGAHPPLLALWAAATVTYSPTWLPDIYILVITVRQEMSVSLMPVPHTVLRLTRCPFLLQGLGRSQSFRVHSSSRFRQDLKELTILNVFSISSQYW